jgi:hypothetical protein
MMRSLSGSIPGKKFGLEPVAMIMFFDVIVVLLPSPSVIATVVLSTNDPTPWYTVMLFLSIRNFTPLQVCATTSSLRAIICVMSASTSDTLIPCAAKLCFALKKCSEESSSALEGIQPTLRHVPPRVGYFSINAVFIPSCAQRIAATYPPGPEPIIVTSKALIVFVIFAR